MLAQGGPRRHDIILTDGFSQRSSISGLEPDERDWLRLLAAHAPVVILTASPWASQVRPAELGVALIPLGIRLALVKDKGADHSVLLLRLRTGGA